MADDYYDQDTGSGAAAPTEAADDTPPTVSNDEDTGDEGNDEADENMGSETSLLPKAFFGDKPLEVGTECKVRIEHVYDDEVEVSYVPHEEEDESGGGGAMKAAAMKLGEYAGK